MTWRAFGLCALLFFPIPILAQPLGFVSTVQSGEHGEFTRLVMNKPQDVTWEIEKSGRSARLTIDANAMTFDVSRVFNRIGRNRISDLRQDSATGTLILDLNCLCEVRHSEQAGRFVILDVYDPNEILSVSLPSIAATNVPKYRFSNSVSDAESQRNSAKLKPVNLPVSQVSVFERPSPDRVSDEGPHRSTFMGISESASHTQVRLLEQIDQAVNLGLVELRNPPVNSSVPLDLVPAPSPVGVEANIRFESAVQSDQTFDEISAANELARSNCVQDSDLEIESWAAAGEFEKIIGEKRHRLYGEFDSVNSGALEALSKTYLYFGFGAEAIRVLALSPIEREDTELLAALAEVMDAAPRSTSGFFEVRKHCPGRLSLWTTLSLGKLVAGTDNAEVERTFQRLPNHLRRHLGPVLAAIFAEAGLEANATSVIRATTRAGPEDDHEIAFAEVFIAQAREDVQEAQVHLESVISSGSSHSANAIVQLINSHFKQQTPVGSDIPDLVSSYAMELRDSNSGAALRNAEIRALSLTRQFRNAFEKVFDVRELDGDKAARAAERDIWRVIAGSASEVELLQHFFAPPGPGLHRYEKETAFILSSRLLAAGFAGQARDVLDAQSQEFMSLPENRLLLARTALELGLPHRAMIDLLGMNGSDADALRAQAMAMNEDFEESSLLWEGLDPVAAARNRWLAEMPVLNPEDEPSEPYGSAQLVIENLTKDTGSDDLPALANASSLLANAAETRSSITALLNVFDANP